MLLREIKQGAEGFEGGDVYPWSVGGREEGKCVAAGRERKCEAGQGRAGVLWRGGARLGSVRRCALGCGADAGFSPAGNLLHDHRGLARARQLPAGR